MKALLPILLLLSLAGGAGAQTPAACQAVPGATCLLGPIIAGSSGAYLDPALNRGVITSFDTSTPGRIVVLGRDADGGLTRAVYTAPPPVPAPPPAGSVSRSSLDRALREELDAKAIVSPDTISFSTDTSQLDFYDGGGGHVGVTVPTACLSRPSDAAVRGEFLAADGTGGCLWSDPYPDRAKVALYPSGCPAGQRLSGTGLHSGYDCAPDETGGTGGATNLTYRGLPTGGIVRSSSGEDATLPLATGTNAGLLSPSLRARALRIPEADCSAGEVWERGSSVWACTAAGGVVNLGRSRSPTAITITASGTDAVLPLADSTNAGLLSPPEKARIALLPNGCPAGEFPEGTGVGVAFRCESVSSAPSGGRTDLGAGYTASAVTITSSTGDDVTIAAGTSARAGVLSAPQAVRIERLPASECTDGQIAKWSGGGFTCGEDADSPSQPTNLTPLEDRISAAERFEAALRRTRLVGTFTLPRAAVAGAYVTMGLTVPLIDRDQRLLIAVDGGTATAFQLSELIGKQRVFTPGTQASPANGISLTLPAGDVLYFAANSAGTLWVADDSLGTQHTVAVSLDELDLEDPARRSSTARWQPSEVPPPTPTNLRSVPTASHVSILSSTGAAATVSHANASAAGVMSSTQAAQLALYPSSCTEGQVQKWSGSAFGCGTDNAGESGGLSRSDVQPPALVGGSPMRWGKAQLPTDTGYDTPHREAVFDAFSGADQTVDDPSIEVGMGVFVAAPSLSTLRSLPESTWVASQEVGPRETGEFLIVRVPSAREADVRAGRRSLDVTESTGTFAKFRSDTWTRAGENVLGTFAYYSRQIPDLPSGARYLVRERHLLQVVPGDIDQPQWRRVIVGTLGTHFAEQFPGVSPNPTSSPQLVATATPLSPTADLDSPTYSRGEFHVSLELRITQSHTSVSFTRDEASPGEEDRNLTLSAIVFASDLREAAPFTTSNLSGLALFEVPVWAASTRQGRYWLILGHDADNEVLLYRHWTGDAGSSPLAISAEARVTFTPSDAPRRRALRSSPTSR